VNKSRLLDFEDVIVDVTKNFKKIDAGQYQASGKTPVIDQSEDDICGFTDIEAQVKSVRPPYIVFGDHTRRFKFSEIDFILGADGTKVLKAKIPADYRYLYHALRSLKIEEAGYSRHYKFLKRTKLVVPPLAEQQRIAEQLDTADRILRLREQAIAKLDQLAQSVFVEMFGGCIKSEPLRTLVKKTKVVEASKTDYAWSLSLEHIESQSGNLVEKIIVERKAVGTSTFYFEPPVVLYSKLRPYLNKVFVPKESGYATTELIPLYADETKILPTFLATYLRSKTFVEFATTNSGGAKMPRVIMDKFWDYQTPLPPISEQRKFAEICEANEKCRELKMKAAGFSESLLQALQHQAFTSN
jgi:type I restriction enzyme, S subunit